MRSQQLQMWAALPTPGAHEFYGRWGLHRGRKLLGIAGPNSSQSPGGYGAHPALGARPVAVWVGEVTRVTFERCHAATSVVVESDNECHSS